MPSIAVRAGPTPRQSAHRPTLRRCEPRVSAGSAPSLTIQGSRYTHIDSIIATSAEDRLMAHAARLVAVTRRASPAAHPGCGRRTPPPAGPARLVPWQVTLAPVLRPRGVVAGLSPGRGHGHRSPRLTVRPHP